MKTIILVFITTLCVQLSHALETTLDIKNFAFLDKTEWEGELMYRNYADFKKVTIPAALAIETQKKDYFYALNIQLNQKPTLKNCSSSMQMPKLLEEKP